MIGRSARTCLGVLLVGSALAGPARAQEPSTGDLQREIQALQESLKGIQKDLQDIKAMLARQGPPPSGVGVVIDYGSSPSKGERTAKLTLVEFSDYQ
jgi:hypothetical protein